MNAKMKKIIMYILISLSIAATGVYVYEKSVNTEIAQQKVINISLINQIWSPLKNYMWN